MSVFVKDKSFYKSFITLSLTLALQNLIVYSVNLADNIMIGTYSETAMNGIALANQIYYLFQMMIWGVSDSVAVLAAQYWGKKDTHSIRRITAIGLVIGLTAALITMTVVMFIPAEIIGLLTDKAAVIGEGAKYIRIVALSYPVFAITTILLASMRSVKSVGIGFAVSAMALIVNISLNYILIFGHFGAPELGGVGAAIATLTSRIVELVVTAVYVLFIDKKLHYTFIRRFKNSVSFSVPTVGWSAYIKSFVKVGLPIIASGVIWGIGTSVQTAILGRLTESVISANSIATTLFSVVSVFAYASGNASSVIIGNAVGSGNRAKVISYAKTLQILYLFIGTASGLLMFLLRTPIISLYDVTAESLQLSRTFLTVLSVTLVGTAYQVPVLGGIVRAGGDTSFVFKNDMIFIWLVVIPSSLLSAFVFHFPPVVVFCCLKCDQILKCFVAIVKVNRFKWIHDLTLKTAANTEASASSKS
ncbi:MAG: MATE family efflux transporter [Ruminococcaceae bacterium]|nr:MATE family efflux transporter [Oscillospiraceae bacterium]